MSASLVIMAAGLGSRYGGSKQVDGIGPHGCKSLFVSSMRMITTAAAPTGPCIRLWTACRRLARR